MSNKKREEISVEQLNDMQIYLGEETIDDYQAGQMSRRRMLRRLVLICGSSAGAIALLAACGNDSATTAAYTGAAVITNGTTQAGGSTPAPTTGSPAMTTAANSMTTAASGSTAAASGTTNASGTTAAAGAKSPLTVPENDPAVTGSMITIKGTNGGADIFAYQASPKAAGTYPGVIVIHENRGLTDHIKDVTRRLAKAGFYAVAPDLASRAGGTAKLPTDNVTGYFGNAKAEDVVADLNTALSHLDTQQMVKNGKYGVVGFCYGGGFSLRFAANQPKLAAAVSYYGPVPQPVTMMSATNAAILGQYGALDSRVNAGIPDLEKTMKDSGKTYEKKIYDGANHAFNNDTGASYNEKAALPAWQATLDWFNKYLKA